ncbi:MAG: hypothetical protein NZ703_02315 [Gemmataceae bacterium]|nr:hypothetical protein [Gemmataceae bacterium]
MATVVEAESVPTPDYLAGRGRFSRGGVRILFVLVLVLAGVNASFVARNSDVWLHRATGRLIANGEYHFGVDPFGQATAGSYWANHAWLFDLGLYWTWELVGEKGVMATKVGLVLLLAYLLWRSGRRWSSPWLTGLVVSLAIVALSPRLLLQPTLLSYVLLAAVILCCQGGGRWLWGLVPLTAVWVNLDSWFFLGPLAVALVIVRPAPEQSRILLSMILAASLAASLCNPHGWHVWTWPMEISPAVWRAGWPDDPRLTGLFASPWSWALLGRGGEIHPSGWALLLLACFWWTAVIASVRRRQIDCVLGLGLLLFPLAAWQVRLTPWWVVAAIPLILREWGRWTLSWQTSRFSGLFSTLATCLLLWLSLPSGLGGLTQRERTLSWGIYEHPGLRHLAESLRDGQQGNDNVGYLFTPHPDVAHYLAWFAPQIRSSFDLRLHLTAEHAEAYRYLSHQLGLIPHTDDARRRQTSLNADGMRYTAAVLYDPDPARWSMAVEHIYRSSAQWRPLRLIAGELLLERGTATVSDWQRLVQQGWSDEALIPTGHGSIELAVPEPWWRFRWPRLRRGSWQAEAARFYLRLHELTTEEVGKVRTALLAVRAARRGLEADDQDARAWLIVARGVQALAQHPWESAAGLPPWQRIRQVQYRAALVQAVRHQPDLLAAHESLTVAALDLPAWDIAFHHVQQVLGLLHRSGPVSGESVENYQQRLSRWQELAQSIERQFRDQENRFLLRSAGLAGQPLARARIAAELGLYDLALSILQNSSVELYGNEGVVLLLELLVQTGRVAEANLLLDNENLRQQPLRLGLYEVPTSTGNIQRTFQLPAYHWFDLVISAAAGRYHQGRQAAQAIESFLDQERQRFLPTELPQAIATSLIGEIGLSAPLTGQLAFRWLGHWKTTRLMHTYQQTLAWRTAAADFSLVRGLLALEQGDLSGARQAFSTAASVYDEVKATAYPGVRLWQRYHTLVTAAEPLPQR